jgi:flagellar assembly protein FliH
LSRSHHRQEAASPQVERVRFEPQVEEATSTPFVEGLALHEAEAYDWTALSSHTEPVPFVPPVWEISGPSTPSDTSSAQLQAGVQEQIQAALREAEREAQQIKEEASAAGFAAGEQAGFEAGQQRLERLLQQLGQALQAVAELRSRIFAQSEHELLELVLAIAKKVLHREVSINRDGIVPLVRAGINRVSQRQEIHLKVHPSDVLFTVSCKAHLLSCLDGVETILFEEDDSVPPGSCMVETPAESVDLRWDEQLEEIAARLLDASTYTGQEVEA